jgi:hypothetical protein
VAKSRGRLTLVVVLLAVGVLVAMYLRGCIPGLGGGGAPTSDVSDDPPAAPKEPVAEAKSEADAPDPIVHIVVEGERCRTGDDVVPCTSLCEREDGVTQADVDATLGAHRTVEELKTCLKDAGYDDVRVRSE